jgi:hypothetical protein
MRSVIHRRIVKLERAIAHERLSAGEILWQAFSTKLQSRMRRTGESLEEAGEALAVELTIDELETILALGEQSAAT